MSMITSIEKAEETSVGWSDALADAERQLKSAKAKVAELESVVRVCKKKVAIGEPWPGTRDHVTTSETASTQN